MTVSYAFITGPKNKIGDLRFHFFSLDPPTQIFGSRNFGKTGYKQIMALLVQYGRSDLGALYTNQGLPSQTTLVYSAKNGWRREYDVWEED